MAKETSKPNLKTVKLDDATLARLNKKALKEKRTVHYLMLEAVQESVKSVRL